MCILCWQGIKDNYTQRGMNLHVQVYPDDKKIILFNLEFGLYACLKFKFFPLCLVWKPNKLRDESWGMCRALSFDQGLFPFFFFFFYFSLSLFTYQCLPLTLPNSKKRNTCVSWSFGLWMCALHSMCLQRWSGLHSASNERILMRTPLLAGPDTVVF